MSRKIAKKVIATVLVTIMLFAYASTIGVYAQKVYATENSLEVQGVRTNNENIEFDAYFVKENQKTHEMESKIGEENSIYVWLSVKNAGYLKNAKIEFTGNVENSKANFLSKELAQANSAVANINTQANVMELNQVGKGEQVNVAIPIYFDAKDTINLSEFSKVNKAKLTGTYVDANGKERAIKAEVEVKLNWTEDPEMILEQQITKYIPYNINNQKGVMMQTAIKTSIINNILPIKETNLSINVPVIADTKPIEVKVTSNSTKASTGDEKAVTFTSDNYQYEEAQGRLTIKVENKADEQGNISWSKNAQDEFIITYIYPEELFENVGQENKVAINTNANITTYGAKEVQRNKTINTEVILKDPISSIVDFSLETDVESLSKGYIYANYEAKEKIETEYKEKVIANIGSADLTDSIIFYSNVDNFILDENTKGATTVYNTNYAYTKEVKIQKEIFDKFLGEEGYINLYQGEVLLSTINKDTLVDEQGYRKVSLAELDTNEIALVTSKPLIEGKLEVEITKALKGEIGYSKNQMRNFTSLEVVAKGRATNHEAVFHEQNLAKEILFTEPTSKAEISINNAKLSTIATNKDVEIRAILKTDSLDFSLYKNPTITITMPSYIENINVKNVQVLFNDELKIKTANLVQNADGSKAIVIELEGTQTKYDIGNIAGGANIVILADIDVNKLTPNTNAEIKMHYTNENVINQTNTRARTLLVEEKETATTIELAAPTGIVTMNEISGYKEGAETLTSISGEEQVGQLEIMAEAREASFHMSVMNNYKNTIENLQILGRTPFAGNKEIETAEELGSNINLNLTTPIRVEGVDASKVTTYYSENGEATKDLSIASNGWTQTPTNLESVKSYLIVVNDYAMNTGDSVNFGYNTYLPENLQHNQSSYQTYAAYYTNNLETGVVEDKQETAKVGATTGKGPVLEAQITSSAKEGEYVLSGNLVKYTVTVKNTGDITAENVVAKIKKPVNYLHQVKIIDEEKETYEYIKEEFEGNGQLDEVNEVSCEIGNVAAGQTVTKDIWFEIQRINIPEEFCKEESHYITEESEFSTTGNPDEKETTTYHNPEIVHPLNDYKLTITVETNLIANNLQKEMKMNNISTNIKNSFFSLKTELNTDDMQFLVEGDEFTYKVNTHSYENTEKPVLQITIPQQLEYTKITGESKFENGEVTEKEIETSRVNYNQGAGILSIDMNTNKEKTDTVNLHLKVKQTEEKVYTKEITLISSISASGVNAEYSKAHKITIIKNGITIMQTSSIPEGDIIENNEEYQYKLMIESTGDKTGRSNSINLIDKLPKEVTFIRATQKQQEGEETQLPAYIQEDNSIKMVVQIEEGTTKEVTIYVKTKVQDTETRITNAIEAYINEDEKIEVNAISHRIEAFDFDNIGPSDQVTRRISGQVWLDQNNDGKKDEEETKVSGVTVMLLNNQTGRLQTNSSGEILRETTTEDGTYTFRGLTQGRYTVIFLYDIANYSSTAYRKEGVDETKNSDAIDTKITLDGVEQTAAITEEIAIVDANSYNIDLGLVVNPKFDLKLDKTVSSITVQDSTGTKTYQYGDSKLAKRDLVGKQINGTTIVVTYKLKVTNEGAVSGFVKKIADYIPTELKFSSELNKDWYQGENGVIYNASLANAIINPGETKEVTLVLTKKLTDENLGLIQNKAEIYEAYNDLGLDDIDSTPGNRKTDEDDYSSADILLTVKTGETIMFIGLTLGIISTVAIGSYVIKRKIIG